MEKPASTAQNNITIPVMMEAIVVVQPTYCNLFDTDVVVVEELSGKPFGLPPGIGLLAFRTAGGVPVLTPVPLPLPAPASAPLPELGAAPVEDDVEGVAGDEDEDDDNG